MEASNRPIFIALGIVGALIVGYLVYLFILRESEPELVISQPIAIREEVVREPEPEPPAPEPVATDAPEPVVTDAPEPAPLFVLPILDDSDQLMRDGVASLTSHGGIAKWLVPDELLRKFVVLVANVADGSIPNRQVSFLAPEGAFKVRQISDQLYLLDESSYQRFDLVTDIFISIDSRRAVEFYNLLRPLFQEAYEELGMPNKKFDDVLFDAIRRLLATPTVSQPIRLLRPVVMYRFADDRLESLSDAQKQMIRMGPRNTRVIQAKFSEIALELRNVLEDR